jgi:hypothetical protein
MRADSEEADANAQASVENSAQELARGQDEKPQVAILGADPKSAVAQASSSQAQIASSANTASRTSSRDDRSSMSSTALAAKIAATVVLPTAQLIPFPTATISTPASQTLPQEKRVLSDASSETPGSTPGNRAESATRIDAKSQEKPPVPGAKTIDGSSATDANENSGSQEAASSESASSAGFALPEGLGITTLPQSNLILPDISPAAGSTDANQSAGKAAQSSTVSNQTLVKTSDAATAGGAGKDTTVDAGSISTSSSAQRATADAAQPALSTSKPADPGSGQLQAITTPAITRETTVSHSRSGAAADAPRLGDESASAQSAENAASSGINTARLIQNMSETEMHVGMHSAEFGEISIRTSVSQQQMIAQISVDHGDLGRAISAHIPAMQEKLGGETGLRAVVEVSQSGMSFSGERGNSSQREQKTYAAAAAIATISLPAETEQQGFRTTTTAAGGNRLDIRA